MKHAHVQIEYTRADGDQAESLIGIDPTSDKDRKFCHDILDEYLDYLARRYEADDLGEKHKGNHFEVFDLIHWTHEDRTGLPFERQDEKEQGK